MSDPEENIFGFVGLKDNGTHYVSSTGLYDYFFKLKEDTREKIITGWIASLQTYLDSDFLEDVGLHGNDEGLIYVSEDTTVVEEKVIADNVVPFPKKTKNEWNL
jgi:hypothetical protein